MIPSLFLILACQLVGEALARLFPIQVPGPVIGMVLKRDGAVRQTALQD